jgi:putative ABC transport system permease protein
MFAKDLLYAARTLGKNPVFSITAVLTIALGIGASTSIFSVLNAVLLRPLPYANPDQLVIAWGELRNRNVYDFPFSNADYFDVRKGATMLQELAGVNTGRGIFPAEDGTPEQIRTGFATPNFFGLLGALMVLGRDFTEADGQPPPPAPPAGNAQAAPPPPRLPAITILSYEYWQRRYGGSRDVLGRTVNGRVIVGVLAPHFQLLFPPSANLEPAPDVWTATRLAYDDTQRNNVGLRLVGRLKSDANLDRAQSQVEGIATELRQHFPIKQASNFHIRLEPMHQNVVAEVRPTILALMGAVIFLLLISCSNVANLLLVRASLRERELAVRAALGGSRWRLVRQMLAESLLLGSLGALAGLALASAGIHVLTVLGPANLPRLGSVAIDGNVLAFAIAAALVSAAIFGVAPALRASRPDLMGVLRGSGRTAGLGSGRMLRNFVVVAEVALSFVLLIGSGLMVRSFVALQRIDPGFDARGVLTFLLAGNNGANPQQRAAFMQQVQQRLQSLPGVQSASAATPLPLDGGIIFGRYGTEQALTDPSKFQTTDFRFVLPGYFETLRTPVIAGRTFTAADNATDRNVSNSPVIIDQLLAAKTFPRGSAVGKRLLIRLRSLEPEWVEVVGVVAHQRHASLAVEGREAIFVTDAFVGHGAAGRWAVRTAGDPAQYAAAVRGAIASINKQIGVFEVQPMQVFVDKAAAGTRFSLLLIGVFAAIAALLASVGLYGVLSTAVRQRTAEIGVRVALGAAPGTIFNLVVGHGLRLSAAGIGVGLLAAFALTRVMNSMLVGVRPTDPITFAAMALLFFVIAAISSWLPARRAASLDPTSALRAE